MTTRHPLRVAACALSALAFAACSPAGEPLPAEREPVAESPPAGASFDELQTAAATELAALEAAEETTTPLHRGSRRDIVEIASATPELSILVAAVVRADLVDALTAPGRRTVFAPTNDAFVALLRELGVDSLEDIPVETLRTVLLSHVVPDYNARSSFFRFLDFLDIRLHTAGPLALEVEDAGAFGGDLTVNGIDVVAADIRASNGLIHVIDAVLPVPDSRPTIVEAAVELAGQGQFTALTAAVVKTGLTGALGDEDADLTVFAPTDAAFARLGLSAASIAALTDPAEIAALRDVLLDHVVGAELSAAELRTFRFLFPLGGLFLRVDRGVTSVNGVAIVAGDAVDARNGVIHVIDGVLLPRR